MANVSQIEDKNGVVKDIVDKGLDEKTSQNSIASSDYVLLEDTDGAYHKIAKASFTEAVRSALGAVINSVAKGNDIAKVPVLDSNNDLGMGTLTNLASVLGVNYDADTKVDVDLNSLWDKGILICSVAPSSKSYSQINLPENCMALLLQIGKSNVVCFQLITTSTSHAYLRGNWGGAITSWSKIY